MLGSTVPTPESRPRLPHGTTSPLVCAVHTSITSLGIVVVAVNVDVDGFEEAVVVAVVVVLAVVLVRVLVLALVAVLVTDVVVAEVGVNCSVAAMWMAAGEVGGTCSRNEFGAVNLPPTFQQTKTAAKLASQSCAKSMDNVCGCAPECEAKPRRQGGGRMGMKESTRLDRMLAFTSQTSHVHWKLKSMDTDRTEPSWLRIQARTDLCATDMLVWVAPFAHLPSSGGQRVVRCCTI